VPDPSTAGLEGVACQKHAHADVTYLVVDLVISVAERSAVETGWSVRDARRPAAIAVAASTKFHWAP
jgi:hypothetical protein